MTMNTMTVRVQADQKAGGKMTGAENCDAAGIFSEVFTQEAASQQTTSSSVVQSSAGATAKLEKQQAQASDERADREAELADEEQDLVVISTLAPEVGNNVSEPTLLLVEKSSSRTTSKDAINSVLTTATNAKQPRVSGDESAANQAADPHRLPGGSSLPAADSNELSAQTMTGAVHKDAKAVSQTANQNTSSGKVAQILAEYAHVTMSDRSVDTEQAKGQGHQAPANNNPEWLAQIEHGRRWAQSPLFVVDESAQQGANGKSLPLDAKTVIDEQDNKPLSEIPKEALSPTVAASEEVSPLSQLEPNTAPDNQTVAPPEPGLIMSTRETSSLLAPADRSPTLDRALTLHGSAEQNAKQLLQQAQVVVSQNLQEADIRLNPSELGGLKIQIKMEQGEVQVQFVASNPQARELIEQAMPRLREMLNQQGMHLSQGQQSGQQQGQQGQNLWAGQQQNLNQAAQQDQQSQQQGSETTSEGSLNYSATDPDGEDVYHTADELTQRYQSDESRIDFFA